MEEAIKNFNKQFDFEPKVENEKNLKPADKFIVCGMGGSHLGAWLLKRYDPALDLLIHRDYGLPRAPQYFLENSLIILSSYSGNTEEVLDVAKAASAAGLNLAALAAGGKLLNFAKENKIPYIQIPDTGIEPRMADGFTMIAIARFMGDPSHEEKLKAVGKAIDVMNGKEIGEKLAEKMRDHIPLVYCSTLNLPIGYNWKIKFNETAKIPAFYNIFPELNHNELSGFDIVPKTKDLSAKFFALLLEDEEDYERIKKRISIFADILKEKGILSERVSISGSNSLEKIFNSILLGEWTALSLAKYYDVPDAKTPLIEEFKHRMLA